jgi:multiple sugar transport system permease protein
MNRLAQQRERTALWLLLPSVLLLVLIFGWPLLRAIAQSFTLRNLQTGLVSSFGGWSNYQRLLGDGRFTQSLTNTLSFTLISVSLELLLGLATALLLHRSFAGRGLLRTVALLPWALPTALIALTWRWIYNDQYGILNDLLQRLHLIASPVNWLGEPGLALGAAIFADVWKTTPFIAIILLAGLQAIPEELYEAHRLDGASAWQSFRRITLPLLVPQMLIASLFRFAQAFGVFDLIVVLTGGGPAGSTESVALYIYNTLMRYLDFGYGAALVVVTVLLLVLGVGAIALLASRFGAFAQEEQG